MVTATSVLSDSNAVYLSLKAASAVANGTLGTDISLPTAQIAVIISSLTITLPTLRAAGLHVKEKIREAANHVKKERAEARKPSVPGAQAGGLEDKKKQFRMSQLAARGRGEPGAHSQGIPSGALPEELSPEQQPGADQLMRKLRNRQRMMDNGRVVNSKVGRSLHGGIKPVGMDHSETTPPLNIPQEEEGNAEQELDDQKDEARQQQKGKGSEGKGTDLRQIQIARINTQRKKTENLKRAISAIKRKIPILVLVLGVAMLKDVLDIVAEAFSIGVWSWFDWLLDIPLGLAAFFLQIERKGTDRVIGWGIMSLEILPYIDLLPAWTGRVIFAIVKRLMEIKELTAKMKKEQKELKKLQKNLPPPDAR